MIYSEDVALKLAEFLLQIKAIKLEPSKPFTWASGWKSPIYCDNRVTLSFPPVRNFIRQNLGKAIEDTFGMPECIAGVATGGIAHGILVAQELELPFAYVRPEAKKHGLGNQIEGYINPGAKIVVVEDLISTGKSSLAVIEALRKEQFQVSQMVSIFNYGFPQAVEAFAAAKTEWVSLCDYDHLVKKAIELQYISAEHTDVLMSWRKDPANWNIG